jgi:hypothetical protein
LLLVRFFIYRYVKQGGKEPVGCILMLYKMIIILHFRSWLLNCSNLYEIKKTYNGFAVNPWYNKILQFLYGMIPCKKKNCTTDFLHPTGIFFFHSV